MDGLAKYDWRNLRGKTQREIAIHRGVKLPKKKKSAIVIHYGLNNVSSCGNQSYYYGNVTDDKNRVDCKKCVATMTRIENLRPDPKTSKLTESALTSN